MADIPPSSGPVYGTPSAPPSPILTQGRVEYDALVRVSQGQGDFNRKLLDSVKILRDAGEGYDKIRDSLMRAGESTETVSKMMQAYAYTVKDLMRLNPTQLLGSLGGQFKAVTSGLLESLTTVGGIAAAIGAVARTFNVLNEATNRSNLSLLGLAQQAGRFDAAIAGRSILRGVEPQVLPMYMEAQARARVMGFSREETEDTMGRVSANLPGPAAEFLAGSMTTLVQGLSKKLGMDLGSVIDVTTTAYRRGIHSFTDLGSVVESVAKATESQDLSVKMATDAFIDIWSATRQFGVTAKDASSMVASFSGAIGRQLLSPQELATQVATVRDLPVSNIAALATLAQGTRSGPALFGTSVNPFEGVEKYLEKLRPVDKGGVSADHFVRMVTNLEKEIIDKYKIRGMPELAAKATTEEAFSRLMQLPPGRNFQERLFQSFTGKPMLGIATGQERGEVSGAASRKVEAQFGQLLGGAEATMGVPGAGKVSQAGYLDELTKGASDAQIATHGLYTMLKNSADVMKLFVESLLKFNTEAAMATQTGGTLDKALKMMRDKTR